MALWICNECSTSFSVDAPKCPQCGSEYYVVQGDELEVPKITSDSVVTNVEDTEKTVAEQLEDQSGVESTELDEDNNPVESEDKDDEKENEGDDDVSPGSSSSTSGKKQPVIVKTKSDKGR